MTTPELVSVLIVLSTLFIHLYLQIAISILVSKSDESSKRKVLQLTIIWLIPFFGVILIGYFKIEEIEGIDSKQASIPSFMRPLFLLFGAHLFWSNSEHASEADSMDESWTDV